MTQTSTQSLPQVDHLTTDDLHELLSVATGRTWYAASRELAHRAELTELRRRQAADLSPEGWKAHYNSRYAAERDARPAA